MTTNITAQHRAVFDALVSGEYRNLPLFSCFVNGEPAAAIAFADTDRSRWAACPRRGALSAASGAPDARSFPVRLRRRERARPPDPGRRAVADPPG
jgi:hypothetical protein